MYLVYYLVDSVCSVVREADRPLIVYLLSVMCKLLLSVPVDTPALTQHQSCSLGTVEISLEKTGFRVKVESESSHEERKHAIAEE